MVFEDRLFVAGPDTVGYTGVTTATSTFGLRLSPGVARAVLGLEVSNLTGLGVDLTELVPLPSHLVADAHRAPLAGLREIGRHLWARAEVDRRALALAGSLDRAARRGTPVGEVAAAHHLSERTLRRLSHDLFGYGLKTLTSIHRFQRALTVAGTGCALAEVAAETGYTDQAHLARETRRLAGTTMSELLAQPAV